MVNANPTKSLHNHRTLFISCAAVTCLSGSIAFAQDRPDAVATERDAEIDRLQSLVNQLRSEVDELKAADSDRWLTQKRADEIRGLVHDVLADADTRASLLQSGAVAGWDNGFFIGSSDGNFLLKIAGQMQFRGVYNHQSDSPTDDNRSGFEMRRAKFDFRGHVLDPSWVYYLEVDINRSGGTAVLGENAWVQKDLGNGMALQFGQFKPAFTREEVISSRRLQAVERPIVHSQFTAGIAQGVQVRYDADQWRARGAFIDGIGTNNTAWSVEDTEYAFTSRFEYLINGVWKDVDDDLAFKSGGNALAVGAAMLYQKSEFGTGNNLPSPDFNNAEVEAFSLTADVIWKNNGLSLHGAVFYRMVDIDASNVDLDQYGLLFRAGYFIRDDIEIFAMYEWGDLDISGIDDLSVFTVGFTKFFNKHNLKWQNDIGYGFNAVASSWAVDSAGWRADASDEDGQVVIRSQFQLLF